MTCLNAFTTIPVTPEILSVVEQQDDVSALLAILLGNTAIIAHKRDL